MLQQSPLDVESMRCMKTLVGKTRGKGVKDQHMVNVEKVNQELDITTMCHTENNEAPKIFIVSSGKDIIALSLGANNLSFNLEGRNLLGHCWLHLVTIMYLTKAFVLPIARYYI